MVEDQMERAHRHMHSILSALIHGGVILDLPQEPKITFSRGFFSRRLAGFVTYQMEYRRIRRDVRLLLLCLSWLYCSTCLRDFILRLFHDRESLSFGENSSAVGLPTSVCPSLCHVIARTRCCFATMASGWSASVSSSIAGLCGHRCISQGDLRRADTKHCCSNLVPHSGGKEDRTTGLEVEVRSRATNSFRECCSSATWCRTTVVKCHAFEMIRSRFKTAYILRLLCLEDACMSRLSIRGGVVPMCVLQ
jgi:hypothetical protein